MKTVEELLKPRYKVIADYPDSPRKIGEILTYRREMAQAYDEWQNVTTGECFFLKNDTFKKYPHLFQSLPWYADRKPEDMPEYVKIQRFYEHKPCAVYKVGSEVEWNYSDGCLIGIKYISGGGTMPNYTLPATATEYEAYHQQTPNP